MIECSNSDSLNDANAVTFERAQGAYDRVDAAATSARMQRKFPPGCGGYFRQDAFGFAQGAVDGLWSER